MMAGAKDSQKKEVVHEEQSNVAQVDRHGTSGQTVVHHCSNYS